MKSKIRLTAYSALIPFASVLISLWLWVSNGTAPIPPTQSKLSWNESPLLEITRLFNTRDPRYVPPATLTAHFAFVEQGMSAAASATANEATRSAFLTAQPTPGPLFGPKQFQSKSGKIEFLLPVGWIIQSGAEGGSFIEMRKDVVHLTPQPREGLPADRDSMWITLLTGDNIVQSLGRPARTNSPQQSALEILEQSKLALAGTNVIGMSAITESKELPFLCWSYSSRSTYSALPGGVPIITFACELGDGQVFLAALLPANSYAYSEAIQILSSMRALP